MSTPENKTPIPSFAQLGRDSWIQSLRKQLRQLSDERKNPPPRPEITSGEDRLALAKLVSTESSFLSLIHQIRTGIDERRHPRERFEATAAPVDVEEIWSHEDRRKAGAISVVDGVPINAESSSYERWRHVAR